MAISIGKYTLESLSFGLYLDPLTLYREYIQNAIDSLDEAVDAGILTREESRVSINIDRVNNKVVIYDNGIGVSFNEYYKILDIGNSDKTFTNKRGFRGIGRLAGISYCKNLVFRTSFSGENVATEISYDCDKLSEMLIPGKYQEYDLQTILQQVTRIDNNIKEEIKSHYFEVTLYGADPGILNKENVISYISQVAPLPYNEKQFSFSAQIHDIFGYNALRLTDYNIYIQFDKEEENRLYKLYKDEFVIDKKRNITDKLSSISLNDLRDDNGNLIAIIWYGNSELIGNILDNDIKGLRLRKGNLLVGDRTTLNSIFKEERFNGWFQGEIFVLDNMIIPNSRRDNFEKNCEYEAFMNLIRPIGNKLSSVIRDVSIKRNKMKALYSHIEDSKGKVIDNINRIFTIENEVFKMIDLITSPETSSNLCITKYKALNLSTKLTANEKKIIEKVLDVIVDVLPEEEVNKVFDPILTKLNVYD